MRTLGDGHVGASGAPGAAADRARDARRADADHAQLCARIPDVSKATVYRHVDLLAAGGILEVADERRVRGAVERRYRLRHDRAVIDADMAESLSLDDYRRGFAAAMAALLAEFNAYLDRDGADPAADLVGYRQHAVWLSRDELLEMIGELRARDRAPAGEPAHAGPRAIPAQPDPVPDRRAIRRPRGRLKRQRPTEPRLPWSTDALVTREAAARRPPGTATGRRSTPRPPWRRTKKRCSAPSAPLESAGVGVRRESCVTCADDLLGRCALGFGLWLRKFPNERLYIVDL